MGDVPGVKLHGGNIRDKSAGFLIFTDSNPASLANPPKCNSYDFPQIPFLDNNTRTARYSAHS